MNILRNPGAKGPCFFNDYELFVIGAGSGGLAPAERERVGGTCVIHGCTLEKLMAYVASFSHVFEDVDEYGWGKVQERINWDKFIAAKDRAIERLSQLHIQHLLEAGVELIYGYTKFLDAHTLDVDGQRITADKILITVGGEAVKLKYQELNMRLHRARCFN